MSIDQDPPAGMSVMERELFDHLVRHLDAGEPAHRRLREVGRRGRRPRRVPAATHHRGRASTSSAVRGVVQLAAFGRRVPAGRAAGAPPGFGGRAGRGQGRGRPLPRRRTRRPEGPGAASQADPGPARSRRCGTCCSRSWTSTRRSTSPCCSFWSAIRVADAARAWRRRLERWPSASCAEGGGYGDWGTARSRGSTAAKLCR